MTDDVTKSTLMAQHKIFQLLHKIHGKQQWPTPAATPLPPAILRYSTKYYSKAKTRIATFRYLGFLLRAIAFSF
jgi:hypothetical protein